MPIKNRITDMLGVEYPIVQAPMGWIARAPLASAVSNAGGLGIIETSSGRLDEVRAEVKKMRDLTTKPFGLNVALAFVRGKDFAGDAAEALVDETLAVLDDPLFDRLFGSKSLYPR